MGSFLDICTWTFKGSVRFVQCSDIRLEVDSWASCVSWNQVMCGKIVTGFRFPVHVLSLSPFRLFSVGARPLLGGRNNIGSTRAIRSQRFECTAGGRTATWNFNSFEWNYIEKLFILYYEILVDPSWWSPKGHGTKLCFLFLLRTPNKLWELFQTWT